MPWTKTHGLGKTRIYRIWSCMRNRCNNPKHSEYHRYGGRGIAVCSEWDDVRRFAEWAKENGYADDLTIDRIDNDKGYAPDNCRWIPKREQAANRCTSHLVTSKGETHNLREWAKITGIDEGTLRRRISILKWDTEKALTTPTRKHKTYEKKQKVCDSL